MASPRLIWTTPTTEGKGDSLRKRSGIKMKLHCIRELVFALRCTFPMPDHPEPQQWYPMDYVERSDRFYVKTAKTSRLKEEPPLLAYVPVPATRPRIKAPQKVVEKNPREKKAKTPVRELAYAAPPDASGLEALVEKFQSKKSLTNPKLLYVKADGNEVMGCAEKNKFLMGTLAKIKRKFGKTPIVDSGYRSPSHNKRVRGAKQSLHMQCRALDIRVPGVGKDTLANYLRSLPEVGGVGRYASGFVHFDNGRKRDWDWRKRKRSRP